MACSNNLRKKTLSIIKNIQSDNGKNFESSFTIPLWNSKRLKAITKKLKKNGIKINTTNLAIQCLLLFQKKINKSKSQINRPVRYNQTECSYEKISIRFNPKDYNALNSQKNHVKISISYMFDLAIRMYLMFVYKLLLNQNESNHSFSFSSRYHRSMKQFNKSKIFLKEIFRFKIKIVKKKKMLLQI